MTHKKTDEGYPIFRSYLETENDEPYYSMNTLSFYYEDMERKQKLIEDLAKAIAGYDQTLTGNLQAIEQQVAERFEQWDEKLKTFDGSVMDLLREWVDDGTMDHIVDSTIVDRKLAPLTAQLAEKAHKQTALDGNKKELGLSAIKRDVPLVSFVDDDGTPAILTRLVPLSVKYKIPFTVGIITDVMLASSTMNVEKIKELQNVYGFEIASHSKSHIPINNQLSKQKQFEELYESWRVLRENGLDVNTFVYPYGESTEYSREMATHFYTSGVSTDTRLNGTPINTPRLGRYAFPTAGWTFNDYKAKVDEAIANKSWLIWMLHCNQEVHTDEQQVILDQLIAYIQSVNVDIVNVADGMNIAGNLLDLNEQSLYIAKNGKNNIRDMIYEPVNNATGKELHNVSSLPNSFEARKVTVNFLFSAEGLAGAPINSSAFLVTTKQTDSQHIFQELKSYNGIWHRYSLNNTWNPWVKIARTNRVTKLVEEIVIGAGSGYNLIVNDPSWVTSTSTFIATPSSEMRAGVSFYVVRYGVGAIKICFYNATTTSYTMAARDWYITEIN